MLYLQHYLKSGKTLQQLTDEYGIMTYNHPELPLVGFKYNKIRLKKLGLDKPSTIIANESRGTVLERDTWKLIAKGFNRFFNPGEDSEGFKQFNWEDFVCTEKIDGSYIAAYNYKGQWLVNTSGSFGAGICGESQLSWSDLFWQTSCLRKELLKPYLTYVFELCTLWNKVVIHHVEPKTYLLAVFDGERELSSAISNLEADLLNVPRPESYQFYNQDEMAAFLLAKQEGKALYEGVVIDDGKSKFKFKTDKYLAAHRLKNNGNIASYKNIVQLILSGSTDEVLLTFPEMSDRFEEVNSMLCGEYDKLLEIWHQSKGIESQKEFALYILPRTKFSSILFRLRQRQKTESRLLAEEWVASPELIYKVLYESKN